MAKLVKLTVTANATQTHVTGAKNWAAVKKATDEVIVEATTEPNTKEAWDQLTWSGDTGSPVPDNPNQRKLSRAQSKKFHLKAELGGENRDVYVWIIGAGVTIKTTDQTPSNSVQFGTLFDGTEDLGAISYDGGIIARGKVAPFAKIEPAGVYDVLKSGWAFKRERWTHDWNDGVKDKEGNTKSDYWNTTWVDDTSSADWTKLRPDIQDKIYDLDGPIIAGWGTTDSETYNNFKQWIEWNGEKCSDDANWYWQGRWQKSKTPQVTLKDVGTGHKVLPTDSFFHP